MQGCLRRKPKRRNGPTQKDNRNQESEDPLFESNDDHDSTLDPDTEPGTTSYIYSLCLDRRKGAKSFKIDNPLHPVDPTSVWGLETWCTSSRYSVYDGSFPKDLGYLQWRCCDKPRSGGHGPCSSEDLWSIVHTLSSNQLTHLPSTICEDVKLMSFLDSDQGT